MSRRGGSDEELDRRFEGRARLDGLLQKAGSLADAEDVAEAFREALKTVEPDAAMHEVVRGLFDEEPRFSSPAEAKALYGNLFGLWDLLAAGQQVDLAKPPPRERPPRPPPPEPPEPFGDAPDDAWVETAWRYLDRVERERKRLSDAFENRQDALVSWLDSSGLSDAGFGLAREVLFEAFALCELGGRKVGQALPGAQVEVPAALKSRADEHLFEAEHDEAEPLPAEELEKVRKVVAEGLAAVWAVAKR